MLTEGMTDEAAAFRLSPQQERLWRAEPDGPTGSVRCVVDLADADPAAVLQAVDRVIDRHEILRTTFARRAGMKLPGQVIHERLDPAIADAHVAPGPDGGLRLTLTVPAACADARSLALVAAEVARELAGSPATSDPLQYADYAEWRGEAVASETEPWQPVNLPRSPDLPFLRQDEAAAGPLPERVPVALDLEAAARGAAACGVTTALFVEACWHACIARVSGAGVVPAGTVLDGRTQEELADAVGPYAQALPLVTTFDETTSSAEVVDQVRRSRARLEQRQDGVDGEALARVAAACRIGFSHVRCPRDVRIEELTGAPAPFLAHLCLLDDGDAARAELQVASALLAAGAAALLAETLPALLRAAAADVTAAVADLSVQPAEGATSGPSLLVGPAEPCTTSSVTALFDAAAARAADGTAIVAPDGTLSYRELADRADRLARRLRAHGVGPNTTVGLCLERSASSIVALVSVLKAGGAYVPLNFEHPAARIAHQLAEAKAVALLTETSVRDRMPPFKGPVLSVDAETEDTAPAADGLPENDADDLAYVMYTSGSTGTPKGVGVTHRNLATYATSILDRLALADPVGASFAVVSALSTDLGNTSIFAALLGGGTLHLVPPADALDGARFAEYVRTHGIDVLKITPSHLRALLGATETANVLPRQRLVLGGEALAWELAERLQDADSSCRILNHYGPTETTIGVCTFEVGSAAPKGPTVPVGRPLARSRMYVVDRDLRALPVGIPGELLIGGDGVAQGYVGNPEQTAERFLPDPFSEAEGARVYRTGDRVRALGDGTIEFLGRADDQVKIHGYRVEPGEVQNVLASHPAVRECAVVARPAGDDHELVAYVVHSTPAPADELRSFLGESLPTYMVPARLVELGALPLTASGKIDRRALPEPGSVENEVEYVAPRTPLEQELALIWQELLGVERVGVNDDFFSLGGHSLLATQAVIRIRNSIGDLPLHSLFNAPTVSALAEAIVQVELGAAAAADDAS